MTIRDDVLAQLKVKMAALRSTNTWSGVDRILNEMNALLAASEGEPHTICKQWCGKVHCEPPRCCFYRSAGEQTMAGAARSSSDARVIPDAGVTPAPAPSDAPHTDHPLRHWDRTCPACVAEGAAPSDAPTAKQEYDENTAGDKLSPVEALRFFCSLAFKNPQDWLDSEQFFDAVIHERDALQAKLDAAWELAGKETLSAAYWKAKADAAQSASAAMEPPPGWKLTCEQCGIDQGERCGWPALCPTGQAASAKGQPTT